MAAVNRKARDARTRGPDLLNPLNKRASPKITRTINDLLQEHRVEMLHEARELGLSGATDWEVCQHFGISMTTLRMWKARDATFTEALQLGKDIADGRVEATLLQKALGYSFRSEEIKVVDGVVVRVPIIKHIPPSDTAIIFWLKNRQRDRWRDVQDHKHEGAVDVNVKDDPRSVAMAILAIMREAIEHNANTIDHDPQEQAGHAQTTDQDHATNG